MAMSNKRKAALIGYDISVNKTRKRVHNCLKAWRIDGQYSLVECFLTAKEADELMLQLSQLIEPTTDRLFLAWLSSPARLNTVNNSRELIEELLVCRPNHRSP